MSAVDMQGYSIIDDYYMPPLTAEGIDTRGMLDLIEAIVVHACGDYVNTCRQLKAAKNDEVRQVLHKDKRQLQAFFHSSWFKTLTFDRADGDKVMETLEHDTPDKYLTPEERKAREKKQRNESNERISASNGESEVQRGQQADGVPGGKAAVKSKGRKRVGKAKDQNRGTGDRALG